MSVLQEFFGVARQDYFRNTPPHMAAWRGRLYKTEAWKAEGAAFACARCNVGGMARSCSGTCFKGRRQ